MTQEHNIKQGLVTIQCRKGSRKHKLWQVSTLLNALGESFNGVYLPTELMTATVARATNETSAP